jgi:hypothetical protein
LIALLLTCASCAPRQPAPLPSQADLNIARTLTLLESGALHLDQPVSEVIQRTHPLHVYEANPFTLNEYDDVPNLAGLSLIARNGKLASATYWTCTHDKQFFSNLSSAARAYAEERYDAKTLVPMSAIPPTTNR